MQKNYLGPNQATSMKLKRAHSDLADELSRCRPMGPEYQRITAFLREVDACHQDLFGRPVKEAVPADRCGPGPSWAETGMK